MEQSLVPFALVALVLVITPGADFAIVVSNALRGRGIVTAVGTATGLAIHALIAAAGLSAIILTSEIAFSAVKYVGAIVLVFLGARTLWRTRGTKPDAAVEAVPSRSLTRLQAYRQGLLVNVLNPKAPLIYLSVMPQFLVPDLAAQPQLGAMSAILVAIALLWYCTLTGLVRVVRPTLIRFNKWIQRVTGAVLATVGIGVALQARPT